MIHIVGNDIMRGGQKIGWIQGEQIFQHTGEKLGYASGDSIYTHDGRKLGYIQGDYLYRVDTGTSIRLEDNREHVSGGTSPDIIRAAVRLLLGD